VSAYILTSPTGPHSRIDNRVIDRMPEIGAYACSIYMMLVRIQNRATGACFPSLKKLMKATGLDKKTIIKYLRVLEREGYVKKIKRYTERGRRTSNQYDILKFWEIAKQVVRNALTAAQEPPPIPGVDPGASPIEELVASVAQTTRMPVPSAASEAIKARQANCSHPDHARRNPTPDYAFCSLCYAEVPVQQE
jgi:hypothetical protein